MDKKNMTYELRIKAIIDEAQKNLGTFEKQLKNTWENGAPPKHMSKSLEGIRARLTSLQEIAKKGVVDSSDLAMAESDYKAFNKTIHDLSIEFKLFTAEQKKAMLSQEEQRAMAARAAAVREYNEELKKSREILEKRKTIENAKGTLQETQKPARARAQASLEDYTKRKENLDKIGGPVLSPAAKEYANTLSEQSKLLDKIKEKESAISSLRSRGLREDRENSLTKTIKELEELKAKQQAFESMAGKSEYDKSMLQYAESMEIVEKGIQDAKAEIASLDGELEVFDKQLSKLPVPNTKQAFADLKKELKELGVEGIEDAQSIEEIEKAIEKLNGKALQRVDDNLAKARKELELLGEQGKQAKKGIDQATQAMKEQEEAARQQEAFENKIKQFLGLAGAAQVMRSALRNAMSTIKELDETMTEMAVVTDLEIGDYWNQLDEHAERASELGRSINDVYKAETLYYQQGLKTNEVIALSTETMKMATIAGLDAEDATNKMTAALRGFNMELNETSAQRISDVYSELAAITAADVGEISSAMTKTASIASSAGMEFETTAAFLSQIIETTRESAETAGTAMKTVIARFQELKKDPAEIGEVDGEIVDANKIETALRTVGVALRDSSGQFRDLDDVFLELSSKWDTLDTNTQRYIATIAAGSRQQSRFIAMMSDYGRTQELVTAANNSAGASQKQFEKTIDSFRHKLNALKTAWEEFSMGILESDLVKFGVDVLTKFLEIINKATSAIDGLGGSIVKIMTVVALFKLGQKVFDKFKTPMMNFFTDLVGMTYSSGVKAGEAFAKGLEDSKKTQKQKEQEQLDEKANIAKSHEKTSASQAAKQAFGIDNLTTGAKNIASGAREEKAALNKMVFGDENNIPTSKKEQKTAINKERKARIDRVKKAETKMSDWETGKKAIPKAKDNRSQNSKDYKAAQKELEEAKKALVEFDETEQAVQKKSIEGWAQVGSGLSQMGTTIASVGIGMSAIGGILDGLGLEAAGEGFAKVGNAITLIGGGISAIGTALMAIPPILTIISAHPIIAIIVAICAVIIATIAIITTAVKNNSIEAKMKAAAEATERAKEAAQEAKEVYDEMVEDRKGFDEMQKKLAGLTKGTKEWKEALQESNALVLELIQTYPDLAQYLERGKYGQLIIADEGWDKMIENQEQGVRNAQAGVLQRELDQVELKREKVHEEMGYELQKSDGTTMYEGDIDKLYKDLKNIYVDQNSLLIEESEQVQKLAGKYETTTYEIMEAARAIEANKEELEEIAEESENIARAHLTTMASQSIQDSDFGDKVIDAFANSFGSEVFNSNVEDTMGKLKEGKDYKDSEEFKRIAREYGVEEKLSGNDTESLKTLYKAVIGVEAGDDMKREDMLKAIAEADVSKNLAKKMDQYLSKLEEMSIKDREVAAGMLSDDGRGLTMSMASGFMDGTELNKDVVNEFAKRNFGSIDDWADMVGKSVDELYNEIEKNIEDSIEINEATFGRLSKALGKSVEQIGNNNSVATENAVKLTDKLIVATQTAGEQGGNILTESLGKVLDSAGPEADKVASLIGSMNWSDSDSWDKLQEELNALNISVDKVHLETFISQIKELGIVVPTVDFNKVSEQIQKMNELIKSINSGEQSRTFNKESYEMLISNNKELANSFVQIGDEFHYLGGSMRDLSTNLKQAAILEAKKAELQLQYQTQIANAAKKFDKDGLTKGEDTLKLSDGEYGQWSREEKIAYLEEFREYAQQEGVETLSYLTDEQGSSLNLSLGTNFHQVSEQNLDQYLKALQRFANENEAFAEEYTKKVSATNVAKNLLLESPELVENAQKERRDGQEITADDYSKALSIQASQSGAVTESIISRYNELIEMDSREENIEEEMKGLEAIMSRGIEKNIANLEKLQQINGYTNQVVAALETKYQKEIDKLSEVNDSINTANEKIVGKIQEQINKDRQDRDNAKKEEEIGKKQSQLAYLLGDTSGASMLQALALQEQITQEQEDYQDTLIDQGLQKLSDDNAAAAEQRERQIEMMQASLDYNKESGNLAREAENIVISSLREINAGFDPVSTKLYEILYQAEEIDGKVVTQQQQEEFANKFTSEATSAANSLGVIEDEGAKEEGQEGQNNNLTNINQLTGDIKAFLTREQDAGKKETENTNKRNAAISGYYGDIQRGDGRTKDGGLIVGSKEFNDRMSAYVEADGNKEDFFDQTVGKHMYDASTTETWTSDASKVNYQEIGGDWLQDLSVTVDGTTYSGLSVYQPDNNEEAAKGANNGWLVPNDEIKTALGLNTEAYGTVVFYEGQPYMRIRTGDDGYWYSLIWEKDGGTELKKKMQEQTRKKALEQFATGGLADFTGPAWLDGTKSHPELVLNARDTENFIQLKDILSEIMNHSTINNSNSSKQDTNYIDIDINVDSVASDYDVEQMADKIRSMLYEDATYRNVNSINLLR